MKLQRMSPRNLLIEDFNYNLPNEKIAKHPTLKRDESKLLIYKNAKIKEDVFLNVNTYLPINSFLVLNNTKVIEARIFFKNKSGDDIEIFCLEPDYAFTDISIANLLASTAKNVVWKCLVGNAKKWKNEILIKKIFVDEKELQFKAKKIDKQNEYFLIEFFWNNDISFAEILHFAGVMPLPPYLHRNAKKEDALRYQTVYAKNDGSVAAPTAGLHFTDELFKKLSSNNVEKMFVTLHVGAGTFKPVKTKTIEQHEMHEERFEVDIALLEKFVTNQNKKIIAVGTTTLRTLESLYWIGLKLIQKLKVKSQNEITVEEIIIRQWDAYELNNDIPVEDSLNALLEWMKENHLTKLVAKTQIIIAPPYKLKIADALITNFHQPKSTLLLLVAAVVGDNWKKIYDYALQNNFRFLSYGDSCLLFPS